jgi:hypothetical protein
VPISGIINLDELEWKPVRPEIARGVRGKPLFDQGYKAVLTRVSRDGGFSPHRDRYAHLMYFLSGRARSSSKASARMWKREMWSMFRLAMSTPIATPAQWTSRSFQ